MPPFGTAELRGHVPAVVGHRGSPRVAPENTPASFAAAARAGATWVELDVRRSADGTLMVHHDAWLADGTPLVASPAADLEAVGVPTLAAVLDGLPPGLGVDVEVKNLVGEPDYDEADTIAAVVAAELAVRQGGRPLMTSSFNPATVDALASALPGVPAGLLHTSGLRTDVAVDIAHEVGARVLCPQADAPGLDVEGVERVHEGGLAVLVWTVDDPARARELAAAGVDAVCTNDPAGVAAGLSLA